ncbi:MAG: hypothetical protein CL758_09020 [Chloroflexi bacterium]|nr:hypothetical protein [Chloroflexota bacterium]MBN19599.1 hypothetical protein [Chloroflexota bacterium]|tara:strand:+ start:1483 stop:2646 length:1164 start_codon:yes stop_codon:yes gene_type:complete
MDNRATIDEYIENNPDCKIIENKTEILDGQAKLLQGFRLPRKLLYYNIKNGRFAKEYIQIIRDEGGSLKPEDPADAKKIQALLLGINPTDNRRTKEDIVKKGQTELALITRDGYIIDGNRRMAIISELFEETSDEKYNFLKVARIDQSIGPKDLWAIEAGISLGQDPKSRYGPINELLKLDEGRKAGFTDQEMAEKLYGMDDASEITERLERLDLMKEYLKRYNDGDDEDFTSIERNSEHFIELQKIIKHCKKNNKTPDEQLACLKIVFRLIHDGIKFSRLRDISDAIKNDYSIEKIVQAAENMEPVKEVEIDPELDEEPMTDTMVRYTDFEDEVKARKNEDKISVILSAILNNFKVLKLDSEDLKKDSEKDKIRQILEYAKKLEDI